MKKEPARCNFLSLLIASIIVEILSIGIYSGSVPLSPSIAAKSVACPFPVRESEP